MTARTRRLTLVAIALATALVLFVFSTQTEPYHTNATRIGDCVGAASSSPSCRMAVYQDHGDFDVAFAEYTDRGNAQDARRIEAVLAQIGARAAPDANGAVVITFIHGWKHNAHEEDSNLVDFKKILAGLAAAGVTGERRLIGLYVGWRGESLDLRWANNLTFWDRKQVAEEVGRGGVTRLLLELDRIDAARDDNILVVIGHSFGGAITLSALSDVLTGRVVQRTARRRYAASIADGIIVLNPAIEANQALHLVEAALEEDYRPEQHPLFVSISSDADRATHWVFPAGQTVGLLLTWRQSDLTRSYLVDRTQPGVPQVLKEEHLDATTVGNFAPFLTHRMTFNDTDSEPTIELAACETVPQACEPHGWTTLGGQPTIDPKPANFPLFFIKTDASVMNGHNDIFNPKMQAFLQILIDDVVARGGAAKPAPSILRQPEQAGRRATQTYRSLEP
ncbi:MAG: hypothetical protein AAF515_03600 [Pseudomonadota bacterium]